MHVTNAWIYQTHIKSNITVINISVVFKHISQKHIVFKLISEKHISCVGNSLVIESTATAGGVAVFDEGFCYFFVEFISQSTGHTFPAQDDNNNNSIGTVVPRPLLHNA